ncbi:hypothetical protein SAMN05421841_2031 [Chryseobacterium wanjuense]|uniref:Uncharacterized protein n=1 Tax=Chryseobacterium wanjuense TaxID=356305 RepID=A0A1I0QNQ4_9FLAO|nr:hypothetical protein SAMN05421841_2031 [Chryseobacterium wanjuense]
MSIERVFKIMFFSKNKKNGLSPVSIDIVIKINLIYSFIFNFLNNFRIQKGRGISEITEITFCDFS